MIFWQERRNLGAGCGGSGTALAEPLLPGPCGPQGGAPGTPAPGRSPRGGEPGDPEGRASCEQAPPSPALTCSEGRRGTGPRDPGGDTTRAHTAPAPCAAASSSSGGRRGGSSRPLPAWPAPQPLPPSGRPLPQAQPRPPHPGPGGRCWGRMVVQAPCRSAGSSPAGLVLHPSPLLLPMTNTPQVPASGCFREPA